MVETERAWQAMGGVVFGAPRPSSSPRTIRRSLYIVNDLQPGQTLTRDNLRAIRPGLGLPPKHLDELLGCTVRQIVPRGTPASWALVR